ncbi:MAG: transposase, partial [Chloroflexota bacterium]|nr:transposase [Chloroflexota bacterium]
MLRVHCVQLFYSSVRWFVGLRLSDALPDETTILHFRHLLEEHGVGMELFEEINRHLAAQGLQLREGTTMDATLIAVAKVPSLLQKSALIQASATK